MSMTGTPIPRINNSISSLSKILATAACIMLIGYVGYLVVAQYRAQVALQKSQQQLITQEIDRRAGASSFFFSAQTNSLKELSQAREIAIYFENQALGMSLEYGLSASLSAVQDRFDTFQQKSRLERHPVYTWLLFLPPRGKPLALSGVDVTATHPRWSRYVRREAQTFYLTDTEEGAARIVISVPCIFKEKVVGQILGIIPLSLVYDHFIGNREGSPDLIALVRDERYLLLPASHQALLSPSLRAAPPRLPPGVVTQLKSGGSAKGYLLAARSDIPETPLSIITFIPGGKYDVGDPRRILAATAGLAVAILTAIFLVFILMTRNTILTTNLEQAALREQEAAEQTRLLQNEVAVRQQAETALVEQSEVLAQLNRTLEQRVQKEIKKSREKELIILQNEKLASIGQLAAGVAHEINNPMGFISSNLRTLTGYFAALASFISAQRKALEQTASKELRQELAATEKELDVPYILDDGGDLIKESLDGANRVAQIVRDLKSFSRIDTPEYEMSDLTSCLESALNIVSNELKYVATIVRELEPLPPILCHPGQLNQVFMNLLLNACHAITPPGTITLRSWHDETSVSVSITDTGHGIPQELRDRIFEPFFTTKAVGKGTGLGLSISYDIIKKHHGEILVESSSSGTTFTIKLPRHSEENHG